MKDRTNHFLKVGPTATESLLNFIERLRASTRISVGFGCDKLDSKYHGQPRTSTIECYRCWSGKVLLRAALTRTTPQTELKPKTERNVLRLALIKFRWRSLRRSRC